MQKLKVLGLMLVVVGALSAVAAGPASAAYNIASGSGGTISGSQESKNVFKITSGSVECSVATFTGSQATETASTLKVKPTYSGCKLAGQTVTVDTTTNSCEYEFQKPVTSTPVTANVKVICSGAGGAIVVTNSATGCVVSVPAASNTNLAHVSFSQVSASQILVTATVTKISYSHNAKCPNSASGATATGSEGTYSGSVLVTGSAAIKVT